MTRISARHILLAAAVVAASVSACTDDGGPTAPLAPGSDAADPPGPAATAGEGLVYSDRAHPLPAAAFALLSDADELAEGRFRYRSTGGAALPDMVMDDFIVTELPSGEVEVRRVLEATEVGDELVLETGPAYWHEIIQGGTYQVEIPMGGEAAAVVSASGPSLAPFSLNVPDVALPALEHQFVDTDVCAWIHGLLDLLPGSHEKRICGEEVNVDVGSGVTVAVAGTLDSLRILEQSRVRVTGAMSISMTVDAGGVSGGRRPSFSPCNRAHYPGCIGTPTGARLIDFLRRYAPAVPEASIPPNRVCIPGTPVRTRAAYWSGWTWNPPRFEQCRVADIGALPTVTLPSVHAVDSEFRPRVTGNMTFRVKGDGKIGIKVAIPGLAASASYQVTNDFKAKAAIGVFVQLQATLVNGGGTVRFDFDDTGRVTQSWNPDAGWDHDFAMVDKNRSAQILHLDTPDSIVVRVGVPVQAKAEVCIALYGCVEKSDTTDAGHAEGLADKLFDELNIGAEVGAGVSMYYEGTWTRPQIHPTNPTFDNWHISVDAAYDLSLNAGVTIPLTGWIFPSIPREGSETWECCRVPVADYWGQGRFEVVTVTSGSHVDPDGYRVVVERMDSVTSFVDEGAEVVGIDWAPIEALARTRPVEINGNASLGLPGVLPCNALYSDLLLYTSPVATGVVSGLRATGFDVPSYAVTTACPFLIAPYRVSLTDVSENCSVDGGAVREGVWLRQGDRSVGRSDTTHVYFEVVCGPPGAQGGLAITTRASGAGPGLSPGLLVDGALHGYFPENDTIVVQGLATGDHELELTGLGTYCISDPVTVTVSADALTDVELWEVCAVPDTPPGGVGVTATRTGTGDDDNGFQILRDGIAAAHLPSVGSALVTGLQGETPTVLAVTDIAGNCQPQAPNPVLVELDASRSPVELDFPVRCVSEPVDSLTGTIDASGWPRTTVTLRTADGVTRTVSGPMTDELARLTGTSVLAWGVTSATGFDVFGYDLRSELGDDRWLGILVDGPSGTWLHGRTSVRLLDAPPGLRAVAGSLVWVMVSEEAEGVRPTLYGVVREGGS